jgi:ATP-dependent Clp protease ATP-binding subunit ClpA
MNWFKEFWKNLTTPLPEASAEPAQSGSGHMSPIARRALRRSEPDPAAHNLTPRAQEVLSLAQKEAQRFRHNFIGTEHLLLGLIALGKGVAVNVLQKMGLDLETVRNEIEQQIGMGPEQKIIGSIPYTPRVRKVLALADKERKALNHTYLGTEHLLLGILREGDGVAARVLKNLDVNIEQTRQEILRELDPNFEPPVDEVENPDKTDVSFHVTEMPKPSGPPTETSPDQPPRDSHEQMSNFTPRAQEALALAREQADHFNHNFVGTEHLLLGLIALRQGTAVSVLRKMGIDLESVRAEVVRHVGTGPDQKMIGNIPYTPRVKKILALAAKEAKALNHSYVGTEHMLLGLLREGDGVGARVLKNFNVDLEKTRQEVLKELDPNKPMPPAHMLPASTAVPLTPGSQTPMTTNSQYEPVDTSLHYDVYCREPAGKMLVYRNVLFKSLRNLFPRPNYHTNWQYVELEQSNGQSVFVEMNSVIRFCRHGTKVEAEESSGEKEKPV